jgi:hypothetical protein
VRDQHGRLGHELVQQRVEVRAMLDVAVGDEASFYVHRPFGRELYGAGVDLTLIVVVVVVTALAFDFTNGFHDTANAMATSIATGALKPPQRGLIAGVLNLVGAFLSIQWPRRSPAGSSTKRGSPRR